jgi:hypothetical protein
MNDYQMKPSVSSSNRSRNYWVSMRLPIAITVSFFASYHFIVFLFGGGAPSLNSYIQGLLLVMVPPLLLLALFKIGLPWGLPKIFAVLNMFQLLFTIWLVSVDQALFVVVGLMFGLIFLNAFGVLVALCIRFVNHYCNCPRRT